MRQRVEIVDIEHNSVTAGVPSALSPSSDKDFHMSDRADAAAPRVLYCTDTYPPQVNGVSVVTALSVAGLRARGWDCMVVAPKYPAVLPQGPIAKADPADQVVPIPSLGFPLYPDIRLAAPSYARVAGVVRRFKPDIIHSATEFMIGRLGQIATKRAGAVRLSSYHTDFSRYTEADGVPWLRGAVSGYRAFPPAARASSRRRPGPQRSARARRDGRGGVGAGVDLRRSRRTPEPGAARRRHR